MHKLVYLLDQLSVTDLGIGPSRFVLKDGVEAMGDGPPADPHSVTMSFYKRIFEEERARVAQKNPDVSWQEVKSEARLLVRHNYYEPDIRAAQVEQSGAIEYDGEREFTLIDGEVTYLNPDNTPSPFTFSSFHERQKNDKKEGTRQAYSEEAHKLDLLVQSALVHATQPIEVTKFAHDKRGIRDLYTFAYDPVSNRGKIRIKNMAPDGKFLTPEAAQQRIQELFPNRTIINPEHNVFMLVNFSSLPEDRILSTYSESVQDRVKADGPGVRHSDVASQVSFVGEETIAKVINEIQLTGHALAGFVDRRVNKGIISREDEMAEIGEAIQTDSAALILAELLIEPEKEKALHALTEEGLDQNIEDTIEQEAVALWLTRTQEVLGIAPVQSKELLVEIERTWGEVNGAREVIDLAVQDEEMQEALMPALFVALEEIAHPEILLVEKDQEEKNQSGGEMAGLILTDKEQEVILAFLIPEESNTPPVKDDERSNLLMLGEVDVTVLIWMKDMIVAIDQAPAKEAIEVIEHEQEVMLLEMSELWEISLQLRVRRPKPATSEFQYEPDRTIEDTEKAKHADGESLSFALALWMLLRFNSYYRSLEALKEFVVRFFVEKDAVKQPEKSLGLIQKLREHIPEGLVQKESAPWILLSIVWYLAMMREQGRTTMVKGKRKKVKGKQFSQFGIIFAFAS